MHEPLLQKIIDQSADSIVIADARSRDIVFTNKRFNEKLGYSADEIIKLKITDLQAYPYKGEEWDNLVSLIAGNGGLTRQNIYTSKDGKEIPLELKGSYIKSEGKEYILTVIRDLSDKNEEHNRLIESERFFSTITENSLEGVSITTLSGVIMYANQTFEQMLGYHPKEVLDRNLLDLVHPADLGKLKKWLDSLIIETGKSGRISCRYTSSSGEVRILEASSINLVHNPVIGGILHHFHDVTEKVISQKKTQTHERYLRHIVNAIPTPVWTTNWNGEITLANQAFANNYPQPLDKLIENNESKASGQHIEANREIMIACEPTPFYEASFREPDSGEKRYVEMRKVPVIVEPDIFELVCVALDVTQHKKSEEELRRKNEELLKLNMELDRFIYSASHELRAPLTSALGLLNLINSDQEKKDIEINIKFLSRTIHEMEVLVRRLSQFSANERSEIVKKEINFDKLIQSVISDVSGTAVSIPDIRWRVAQSEKFYSDELRIFILLKNLLENAIKYKDDQKSDAFIQIIARVFENKALLEITDNGIGIPEKYLDRIFNMFSRVSSSGEGAGLGLYIVKETVKKLNGKIEVKSLEGKGSSFMISLPCLH